MIVKMTRYAFCNMKYSHVIDYSSTLKFAIILISTNSRCVECVMSDEQWAGIYLIVLELDSLRHRANKGLFWMFFDWGLALASHAGCTTNLWSQIFKSFILRISIPRVGYNLMSATILGCIEPRWWKSSPCLSFLKPCELLHCPLSD
jgi:hypothetical protein